MRPRETIALFDQFLAERGLSFDAVVIGGVALELLGVISRGTRDCDVLHPAVPHDVAVAARAFAAWVRSGGEMLRDDWLNDGPSSLIDALPSGWKDELQVIFEGAAVVLRCPGRLDLLRSKLWALCDRGLDLPDCIALAPTPGELAAVLPWLEQQDGNPSWPEHVRATLADLQRRLGHGT